MQKGVTNRNMNKLITTIIGLTAVLALSVSYAKTTTVAASKKSTEIQKFKLVQYFYIKDNNISHAKKFHVNEFNCFYM